MSNRSPEGNNGRRNDGQNEGPEYSAPSPSDMNPTEPLSNTPDNSPTQPIDTTGQNGEPTDPNDPTYNGLRTNDAFPIDDTPTEELSAQGDGPETPADQPDNADPASNNELDPRVTQVIERADSYFSPENPNRIELFDKQFIASLTARAQKEKELNAREFTVEELDADHPDGYASLSDTDPVKVLYKARFALNRAKSAAPTGYARLKIGRKSREKRAALRDAQEAFNAARTAYIDSQLPSIAAEDPATPHLRGLTVARIDLAEASVAARNKGNRKTKEALRDAQSIYASYRNMYIQNQLNGLEHQGAMPQEDRDLVHMTFLQKEQGALAGEEAGYYLTEVQDTTKQSRFQKIKDGYNSLTTKQKIVTGLGVAAVSFAGFGAVGTIGVVGAVAATGGSLATKFGKNLFLDSAKRSQANSTDLAREQASVLYAGNAETDTAMYEQFADNEQEVSAKDFSKESDARHNAAIQEERRQNKIRQMKSVGKVAVLTCTPIVGGYLGSLLGSAIEHMNPSLFKGAFREDRVINFFRGGTRFASDKPSITAPAETPTGTPPLETPAPSADVTPAEVPLPQVETPTSHNSYLYGELAGKSNTITVPQGSSIWEQLSSKYEQANASLSPGEIDRLVANTRDAIQQQYPTLDLNNIPSGQRIDFELAG